MFIIFRLVVKTKMFTMLVLQFYFAWNFTHFFLPPSSLTHSNFCWCCYFPYKIFQQCQSQIAMLLLHGTILLQRYVTSMSDIHYHFMAGVVVCYYFDNEVIFLTGNFLMSLIYFMASKYCCFSFLLFIILKQKLCRSILLI